MAVPGGGGGRKGEEEEEEEEEDDDEGHDVNHMLLAYIGVRTADLPPSLQQLPRRKACVQISCILSAFP